MQRPGRPTRRAGAALFWALLALAAPAAWAQSGEGIALSFPAPLTTDIEAMPRMTGDGPAAAQINARLARWDAEMRAVARDCDTDPPQSLVRQDVDLVFAGPNWLGLVTHHEYWCPGTLHGTFFTVPLTLDLSSGAEVDWASHFPASLLDPGAEPFGPGAVWGSAELTALYLSQATDLPPDCREEVAASEGRFLVWPSAADRALVLMPAGLPHAVQACADIALLPADRLRASGFPPALTDTLVGASPIPAP